MAENKFLNKKTAAIGAGLVAAYLIYKTLESRNEAREGMPQGSLGGEDDLEGQQGFDIDPNSPIPQNYTSPNDNAPVNNYFIVTPEGEIIPSPSPTDPQGGGSSGGASGIPSSTPTYSTGTGSLVQDAVIVTGATGFNLLLPNLAKGIKGAIDTKYAFRATGDLAAESNFQKWLKDPYNIGDSAASKVLREGEQAGLDVVQSAEKPVVREAGEQVLQTMPKWAKGVKGVANFIPLLDIPIGAGLDVWFSRYEEDPTKKIGWGDAFAANTAGELAQLGITGAAAAAGTVVPVAGNIAGGVGGFIVGTGADIAATEAYYKARGKSSLFDLGGSSAAQKQATVATAAQQQKASTMLGLTSSTALFSSSGATYDPSTYTYTSSSGAKQSMQPSAPQAQAAAKVTSSSSGGSSSSSQKSSSQQSSSANYFTAAVSNPFSSSSSSSSSSSQKSSSQNMSIAPTSKPAATNQTSSAVKSSNVSTAPKTGGISGAVGSAASVVKSAVTSTVSKISSFFGGSKSSSKKK